MSKYKDTLLICHSVHLCGQHPCAHNKAHEPIIMMRGGKNVNFCKMACNVDPKYGVCKPVKMNTKWDL